MNWHTREERKVIKKYGGRPLVKYGYDGMLNGAPVEVRSARKDHRYRIQQNTHNTLVKKRGSYIFVNGSKTKKVGAKTVSKLMGSGKWFKDRTYPHKFVTKKQLF